MNRRQSVFKRGNRRHAFIHDSARLSHLMQIRAGDSLRGLISSTKSGMSARIAGDLFPVSETIPVRNTNSLSGIGYATELRLTGDGPVLRVTANDVVIENIRFVYNGIPATTDLITRPVRCSGETYSPAALSASTVAGAIVVTGDNVTIRNCWFDGFDNAIYSTAANTTVHNCHIKGQFNSTKSAIYLDGTLGNVRQCYVETTAYGVYVAGNYSSVADNTILATESGIFVTSDYNRIHGNVCEGHADGFAINLTVPAQYNSVTGNMIPPDDSKGTYYFITPATSKNQYGANIGTVDLE